MDNMNNAGLGVGYGLGPETIVGQNPDKFNISWHKYQNHWITKDLSMGGTHVMTRVKCIHMWLDFFRGCTEVPISYPVRAALEQDHYKIVLDNPDTMRDIEYEKFDYNIIKPNINVFADRLVNEMWPFFRNLWRSRGGYTAEVRFHPELDLKEFGSQYGPGMYYAIFNFKINDAGQWHADFKYKFEQIDNPYDDRPRPPEGRKGPFYAQDYSRLQSNTAKRARKIARPVWDVNEGRSGQDFTDLLEEEAYLNANIDFSFEYHYVNDGDWSDYEKYRVDVSDIKRDALPEKEVMDALDFAKQHKPIEIAVNSIKKSRRPLFPV